MTCPVCQYELEDSTIMTCPDCGANLKLLQNLNNAVEDCYRRARTLLLEGRALEALFLLKDALDLDNTDPRIYRLLGAVYEALGERELAMEAVQTALQYDPNDEFSLRLLQRLQSTPVQKPQPIVSLNRKIHFFWASILVIVSIVLIVALRFITPPIRETKIVVKERVLVKERPILVQQRKVEATDRQGLSLSAYIQLRYVQNQTIHSIYQLACKAMHQGKYQEALTLFERANPIDRKSIFDDDIAYRRGLCLFYLKRYKEAEHVFAEITQLYPKSDYVGKALYKRARCLEILGKFDDARNIYQKIIKDYSSNYLTNSALRAIKRINQYKSKEGIRND
jgi:tetratricopeptide (TPR) repeat protein